MAVVLLNKSIGLVILVSISSTFYKQFLRAKIAKVQKTDNFTVYFALLGSACVKAARKHIGKLTPCVCSMGSIRFCHFQFVSVWKRLELTVKSHDS